MDRFELFNHFVNGDTITIKGCTGIIKSLEREDGSGYRFNIVLSTVVGAGFNRVDWKVYLDCGVV